LTVTVPPRRPDTTNDRDLEQRVADLEALIEEARRRARRRRTFFAAALLLAIAAGVAAAFGIGGGGGGVSLGSSVAEGSVRSPAAQPGQGSWRPSHGPDGGDVFTLAIDPANPAIVYAGDWGNVFKSTNGGGSWKDVTTEPWTRVTTLTVDPTQPAVVYAGTDRGIAKTVDGGRRWQMVNGGLFDGTKNYPRRVFGEGFISSLVVDPGHPSTVYAITGIGLFKTTNGGARWRIIGPPRFQQRSCPTCFKEYGYELSAAIDLVDAQTIYASWARGGPTSSPNLYKSSDGGDSWQRIDVRTPRLWFTSLAISANSPGALFATSSSRPGVVLESPDGGVTWNAGGPPGQSVYGPRFDPGNCCRLYATTESGALFKTTDGGATWQKIGTGANLPSGSIATDPQDSQTMYGAGDPGVVKSLDGGETWAADNAGLISTVIRSLVLAPGSSKTLYAGTGSGLFESTDGGLTWRLENNGLGTTYASALAASPQSPHTIYAGTSGSGVFKSTDAGLDWTPANTGLATSYVEAVAIDPHNASTIYAVSSTPISYATGRGGAIFKTIDGGTTWLPIGGPTNVQTLAVDPQTDAVFADAKRGVYRSRDGGRSWQLVGTAPGAPPAGRFGVDNRDRSTAIAIAPHAPETVYVGLATSGVFKSSGGGAWVAANSGLTNKHITTIAVDPRDSQIVYVGTEGGVFRSTDGARTWQPYGRGLTADGVDVFAIDPTGHTVYAGTGGDGVVAVSVSK
jgi:photosystem II stability/assembly factor-like uncharacterized protein